MHLCFHALLRLRTKGRGQEGGKRAPLCYCLARASAAATQRRRAWRPTLSARPYREIAGDSTPPRPQLAHPAFRVLFTLLRKCSPAGVCHPQTPQTQAKTNRAAEHQATQGSLRWPRSYATSDGGRTRRSGTRLAPGIVSLCEHVSALDRLAQTARPWVTLPLQQKERQSCRQRRLESLVLGVLRSGSLWLTLGRGHGRRTHRSLARITRGES